MVHRLFAIRKTFRPEAQSTIFQMEVPSVKKPQGADAKKAVEEMRKQAREAGTRIVRTLAETPELVRLERNERALKNEMDHHLRAIGLQVLRIHKRAKQKARGKSPFADLGPTHEELKTTEKLGEDLQKNREKMARVREKIRNKK
jgi:hypothetical protein